MTSTIKVDNIQDQDGNNIINENANTITIGASGDTVTLASGASQSGFGRTGTVDWDTTKKTASFTATNGEGYFVDSSSSTITVTLPASPSANNIVSVSDYNGSAATNTITIARNSSNINGDASDYLITEADSAVTFVYVDATVGWTSVQTSNPSDNQNPFIVASGGTITCCGDYKIHTFTGPGTFTVTNAGTSGGSNTVDYLVIAGGGNGGGDYGGGGGAGGYRFSNGTASGCYSAGPSPLGASALPVSVQAYPITVGAGGTGSGENTAGNPGSNSIFSSITSAGGGKGGTESPADTSADNGGSGGGAMRSSTPTGNGNTPPVSPPQGNPGGGGGNAPGYTAGGGGGAGAAGQTAPSNNDSGDGGAGLASSITGSPVTRGGGGGGAGGGNPQGQPYTAGTGGPGGGGGGVPSSCTSNPGTPGTVNTGGGGGGAALSGPSQGGNGGSGIVIIRYKFQ